MTLGTPSSTEQAGHVPEADSTQQAPSVATQQIHAARSPGERFFWLLAFLIAAFLFTPGMKSAMQPPEGAIFDFFKEWAAVRNWQSEMPLYTPQRAAIRKHLGLDLASEDGFFDPYNTHPPTANLFAVPFGGMSYRNAHLAWNLTSLILLGVSLVWIARELHVPLDGTVLLAAATLLLASDPLKQSLIQGQPNLLMGFLIVAAWRADRRGHSWLSGACLATAATIKLYPAYLFLYALARRDWKAIVGGAVAGLSITAVTVGVFGVDAYRDYAQTVLPELRNVTNNWGNSSLLAFWERLLGAPVKTVRPAVTSPHALKACLWMSWLAVTTFAGWRSLRAESRSDKDAAFAVVVLAMLLMSPTTWHHYFVLAAIPVCVALKLSHRAGWQHSATWLSIIALTLTPRLIWTLLIRQDSLSGQTNGFWERAGSVAVPWQSLTALSYQMYALLLLMAVLWRYSRQNLPASPQPSGETGSE